MVAAKKIADNRILANDDFPPLARRIHAHNPEAGKKESREVLVRAATPHSSPNAIHGRVPSSSSSSSVSQKMTASSSAARLVSQTQRTAQYITGGSSTHAHALHTATLSLKHFLAMAKIATQVNAEKMLLIQSRISAAD